MSDFFTSSEKRVAVTSNESEIFYRAVLEKEGFGQI